MDDSILSDYLSESREILSGVENALLALEKDPGNKELLNQVFRGFHTIKGGASFIQAEGLVVLCHNIEFLFDQLRSDALKLSATMMDSIFAVTVCITQMLNTLEHTGSVDDAPDQLLESIRFFTQSQHQHKTASDEPQVPRAVLSEDPNSVGTVSSLALGRAGTSVSSISVSSISTPAIDASQVDRLNWDHLLSVVLGSPAEEKLSPSTRHVDAHQRVSTTLGVDTRRSRSIEVVTEKAVVASAAAHNRMRPELKLLSRQEEKTVRVDIRRLDKVLHLSSEIGLVRNSLRNICSGLLSSGALESVSSRLDSEVNRLNALVNSLHDSAMRIRMQPIGRLFSKYPRTIREMARSLDKEVELELVGEDTELDKTMIDELNEPLVHMLRNAIDHGIEGVEEREKLKKPPVGKMILSAAQEGEHVVIRLEDDGRGIDPEKMRRLAVKKNLISEDDALKMNDAQSLRLIFMPGFSSVEKVTNLSGRGVGMDVVLTNLKNMNGDVQIHSVVGSGTSFELRVPLTLMMMPIVVVGLNDYPFAIPLSFVREVIPIHPEKICEINGYAACKIRHEILPIIDLSACLSWSSLYPPSFGVVIAYGDACVVLGVDRFYRRDEAVVRSLNSFKPKGITGMSTSSEGESILILDIKDLAPIFNYHKIPRHQWTRLFSTAEVRQAE